VDTFVADEYGGFYEESRGKGAHSRLHRCSLTLTCCCVLPPCIY
jgi:hypothetical protein